ncbi:GNAT family N-acetyltransferase [Georgenia wangjunii]|uniref:GNAT family N-acetyltransferase n=1 Tax=Georgenia wangjunii TaxID=3117730 RepID=UPI002F267F82
MTTSPLPAGYRLAELDGVADRDAIIDVDGWAFAYELSPEDEPARVWDLEPGRIVGVWDERDASAPRLAALHASYAFSLPVPGGVRLPTAGLTWVGVHPGHRRRGIARAMLTAHLERSLARGEVLSALNAAETGIYGRYGYGVATHAVKLTLSRGAELRDVEGSDALLVDLDSFDPAVHLDVVERVHTAVDRPGWITRDTDALRASHLTDWPSARKDTERLRIAVVRTSEGEPRAYAVFRRREKWSAANAPEGLVRVREAVALDAPAARALWGTLTDLDLMATIETNALVPDDALVHLLTDLRGVRLTALDDVWVRILDVPGALAARRYQADLDVVLDVRDDQLPANAGRWHVRGGWEAASAERTEAPAHLALDVADLASAYLGGTSLAALAGAGRVRELVPGALARASAAFGWPVAPGTSWGF